MAAAGSLARLTTYASPDTLSAAVGDNTIIDFF
jgi:hypothetical protein